MTTDWTAVERDYVRGGVTYTALAEKYGVSCAAVSHRGTRGGWRAKRREYLRGREAEHEAPCPGAAEREATRPGVDAAALRMKLLALADNWTEEQSGRIEDVGDYRRVVQSVLDLTRAEGDDAAPEVHVVMDLPGEYLT